MYGRQTLWKGQGKRRWEKRKYPRGRFAMSRHIIFSFWVLILVFINSVLAQDEIRISGGSLEIPKQELPEGHQVLSEHSNPSIRESINILCELLNLQLYELLARKLG